MPGLIQQAQQPQAQPGGQPGQPQANPQDVERVVVAATKVIHDPKISQQLIEMMKAAGDPVKALAEATIMIMRQLYEKSGKKIPPEVLGAAGVQVLQLLAELAQTAGLFKVTMDMIKQAAQAAMDQVKSGMGAPEQQGQPAQAAPMQAAAPGAQPAAA